MWPVAKSLDTKEPEKYGITTETHHEDLKTPKLRHIEHRIQKIILLRIELLM